MPRIDSLYCLLHPSCLYAAPSTTCSRLVAHRIASAPLYHSTPSTAFYSFNAADTAIPKTQTSQQHLRQLQKTSTARSPGQYASQASRSELHKCNQFIQILFSLPPDCLAVPYLFLFFPKICMPTSITFDIKKQLLCAIQPLLQQQTADSCKANELCQLMSPLSSR